MRPRPIPRELTGGRRRRRWRVSIVALVLAASAAIVALNLETDPPRRALDLAGEDWRILED